MDQTTNEPTFDMINQDIKTLLAELGEIACIQRTHADPEQIKKNNEAFIQMLDQILDQINTLKSPFEK